MAESDRDALVAIHVDPRANTHAPGGAPLIDWAEGFLVSLVEAWLDELSYWTVESDGVVVGFAGVEPRIVLDRLCWNLYYRFDPDVWGKGFATEAVREAVAVAEAAHRDWPVVAQTRPANTPAIRVAERAGLGRRPDLDHDGFVVLTTGW